MLYDPKWEKPAVKADPFSLESLIAWLEKQPADKTYCYVESNACLLSQYFSEKMGEAICIVPEGYRRAVEGLTYKSYPAIFNAVARGTTEWKWTFGAALSRARALMSEQQRPSQD